MHRNDGIDADPTANGVGRPGFREGDPNALPPVNASEVNAKILNSMQEELSRSVELLGETLDDEDNEQLGTILAGMKAVTDDVGPRVSDGEWVYPTPKTRTTTIGMHQASHIGSWLYGSTVGAALAQSNAAKLYLELSAHLPEGAVVTRLRLLVDPGAVRAGTNRMSFGAYIRTDMTFATPGAGASSLLGPYYDNGTTDALQTIDSGAISVTVSRNDGGLIAIALTAGHDAAANNDLVYALEVTWTDPGPRNA